MAGSATLDPDNLVDSLVADVIDGLREDLHPQFGVRPYRVYLVRRSWSGREPGQGTATDTETEIRPQPDVNMNPVDGSTDLRNTLEAAGLDEAGTIKVQEVSLTYSSDDLTGGVLADNEQFFIRIDEALGQGQPSRWYVHDRPLVVDRSETMGWILFLRRATP